MKSLNYKTLLFFKANRFYTCTPLLNEVHVRTKIESLVPQ